MAKQSQCRRQFQQLRKRGPTAYTQSWAWQENKKYSGCNYGNQQNALFLLVTIFPRGGTIFVPWLLSLDVSA